MSGAAISLLVWTTLGLFFGGQHYLASIYADQAMSWTQALLLGLSEWYLWALFALGFAQLARRLPFERGRLGVSLSVTLPITLVAAVLQPVIREPMAELAGVPLPRGAAMETFHLNLLTCWMILGACHALQQYRASQNRREESAALETRLARAQLQLLRTQLQPHFLFNTLHATTTLIRRDPPAAEEMVARLSELLRLTLERGDVQELPLKEELDFVTLYLRIQEVRFRDRLRLEMAVDPAVLHALVPNMLLQPIVENAVQHGVSQRVEAGIITLSAGRRDQTLVIQVRDDGPGLSGDGDLTPGIGLTNTRERLERLYGGRYALRFESLAGGGLEVTLELPLRVRGGTGAAP